MNRREGEGDQGRIATREDHTRRGEEGTGRPGCRSKFWSHVTRDAEKEGTSCRGRSKCWASEDRRDELCVTREDVRDEFSKIHGDQGDYLSKTREGQRKNREV